jgi:4-amino-4-deoxy-L-arabinose transferase-like glycosyltransferase
MAPWIIFFGAMLVAVWKRRTPDILVLAGSVLLPLLLVSFAGKLRSHYLLPLIPACAVLLGWTLLGLFERLRDSASATRGQWLLLWSQYALTGLMVVALIAVFADKAAQPFADLLDAGAIVLLLLTAAAFVASALAARRGAGAMFSALALTVLFCYGAFAWMNLDEADSASTSHAFVQAVEAYLPDDAELYIDPSIRLVPYYYHSSRTLQKWTPLQWSESVNPGPPPYFITLNRDVERDGIPGEILIEQAGVRREVAMVLFHPAPPPR